jgi:hypothetical protein
MAPRVQRSFQARGTSTRIRATPSLTLHVRTQVTKAQAVQAPEAAAARTAAPAPTSTMMTAQQAADMSRVRITCYICVPQQLFTHDNLLMQTVLGIILGGGAGSRLYPLTKMRAKPAVPLGANYRLIDIPVSNCLNSGVNKIYCLTQYNSASLNRHLSQAYVSPLRPLLA